MTLLPRPSTRDQRRITRAIQVILVVLVGYGVASGHPKTIVNATLALAVTFLPAVLEHNYELPLDPWLGLWIAAAVFLHTLGSAGLYTLVPWWDHLTHALSASLVAGVGYTAARTVDLHSDDIHIPRRFAFAYVVVVVLSFGVLWELFEYALDLASTSTGLTMPLAQHGLDDTVRDLVFNSVGALVVAAFAHAHLTGLAETIRAEWLAAD